VHAGRSVDNKDEDEKEFRQRQDADTKLSACSQNMSTLTPTQLSSMMTNAATTYEKLGDRKAVQDCLNVMTRLTDTNSATC